MKLSGKHVRDVRLLFLLEKNKEKKERASYIEDVSAISDLASRDGNNNALML